jgi:hypothetical protein
MNKALGIGVAVEMPRDCWQQHTKSGCSRNLVRDKRSRHRIAYSLSGIEQSACRSKSPEENIMSAKKQFTTYLLGAGLALSVAAFAPATFAQSSGGAAAGALNSNMGSTSTTNPGNSSSNGNGKAADPSATDNTMTSPSASVTGSDNSAANSDYPSSPDNPKANDSMGASGNVSSSTASPGTGNWSGTSNTTAP